MKRLLPVLLLLISIISCKSIVNDKSGNFILKNNSEKVIEFIWITEEGEPWPTTQSVNIEKEGLYELKGLSAGLYDVAIDFKDHYEKGENNSKFDKSKCLLIEKGITKIWIVDENGNIIRD